MQTSVEAWKDNLRTKIDEIRELLLTYLTRREGETAHELSSKLDGLDLMFARGKVPQTLHRLRDRLQYFQQFSGDEQAFLRLFESYGDLVSVTIFEDEQEAFTSFDEIFESYKNDETLNSLVDELVGLLQRVISEGNEVLTAQVVRELESILRQVKNRKRMSFYELLVWIELCLPALVMIVATHENLPQLIVLDQAILKTLAVKQRLLDLYKEAKSKLITQHELAFTKKALNQPEVTSEEQAIKLLKTSDHDL